MSHRLRYQDAAEQFVSASFSDPRRFAETDVATAILCRDILSEDRCVEIAKDKIQGDDSVRAHGCTEPRAVVKHQDLACSSMWRRACGVRASELASPEFIGSHKPLLSNGENARAMVTSDPEDLHTTMRSKVQNAMQENMGEVLCVIVLVAACFVGCGVVCYYLGRYVAKPSIAGNTRSQGQKTIQRRS